MASLLRIIGVLYLLVILFMVFLVLDGLFGKNSGMFYLGISVLVALLILAKMSIRVISEWEEAVILRLGKYQRTVGAGLFLIIPFIETVITRDRRVQTLDIEHQVAITKDNVSVSVDAVAFMQVIDTKASVVNIQDYYYSVAKFSQTTLRNVVGKHELDDLLTARDKVADEIKDIVDEIVDKWGVDIQRVELQDISLPEEMKRVMARQAEAERDKRGVIIEAQGELAAAEQLRQAADILMKSPGAMELRRLKTVSDVSQEQSNTIVFAVPLDSLRDTMSATSGLQVPKPRNQTTRITMGTK